MRISRFLPRRWAKAALLVIYVVASTGVAISMLSGFHSFLIMNEMNRRSTSTMRMMTVNVASEAMLKANARLPAEKSAASLRVGTRSTVNAGSLPNCSADLDEGKTKSVLDRIQVLPMTKEDSLPSVLCYIMCTSEFHRRAEIIKDTWGNRCDRFIIASNETDEALGAVAIPAKYPHSWENLWDKQRETIRYLYDNNISQQYDWTFKADSDSYVIVDNLKHHLSKHTKSKDPLVVGRGSYVPDELRSLWGLLPEFTEYFHKHQTIVSKWRYVMGGGYAMNQDFIEKMVGVFDADRCRPNRPDLPEDVMTAFCVASSHRLYPLWANHLYHHWPPAYYYERDRKELAAQSVLFHNIKDNDQMFYFIHDQLYSCRKGKQQNQTVAIQSDEPLPRKPKPFSIKVRTALS